MNKRTREYTLEKKESPVRNGESRETGNIVYGRQNTQNKQNKHKN